MPSHCMLTAWIEEDEHVLQEEGVVVDEEKRVVTCWIPGGGDKPFSLHWASLSPTLNTYARISVDGVDEEGWLLLGEGTCYKDRYNTQQKLETSFKFKTMSKEDEHGTITLTVMRVQQGSTVKPSIGSDAQEEVRCSDEQHLTWEIVCEADDAPYVTFIFHYRLPVALPCTPANLLRFVAQFTENMQAELEPRYLTATMEPRPTKRIPPGYAVSPDAVALGMSGGTLDRNALCAHVDSMPNRRAAGTFFPLTDGNVASGSGSDMGGSAAGGDDVLSSSSASDIPAKPPTKRSRSALESKKRKMKGAKKEV